MFFSFLKHRPSKRFFHKRPKRKTRHVQRHGLTATDTSISLVEQEGIPEEPLEINDEDIIPLVNEEGLYHEIERRESSITNDQL